ncbi:MAG: hypothetical protein GYB68_15880 [Chloroflexi bacterium]|nr:hypothetical protein [Chloroflexota bacterium]
MQQNDQDLDAVLSRIQELSPSPSRHLRLLACDFAEHVLHLFESAFPDDDRPRQAIMLSRRFAHRVIDQETMAAACGRAWEAAADPRFYDAPTRAAWAAERACVGQAWEAASNAKWAAGYAAAPDAVVNAQRCMSSAWKEAAQNEERWQTQHALAALRQILTEDTDSG